MEIYVGSASRGVSEDNIRRAFREFGEVESATIVTQESTGEPIGIAVIPMSNVEQGGCPDQSASHHRRRRALELDEYRSGVGRRTGLERRTESRAAMGRRTRSTSRDISRRSRGRLALAQGCAKLVSIRKRTGTSFGADT